MGVAASAGTALPMAQSSMSIISSRAGRIPASPSPARIFKCCARAAIAAKAIAPTIGGGCQASRVRGCYRGLNGKKCFVRYKSLTALSRMSGESAGHAFGVASNDRQSAKPNRSPIALSRPKHKAQDRRRPLSKTVNGMLIFQPMPNSRNPS
jgi:hypothetical protein